MAFRDDDSHVSANTPTANEVINKCEFRPKEPSNARNLLIEETLRKQTRPQKKTRPEKQVSFVAFYSILFGSVCMTGR